ncbi:MAG: radical SAM protein [bacterium]
MVYALQTGCVYGPINSRRLGRSLGVNLLPPELKLCPFDCVYCHYGKTDVKAVDLGHGRVPFPSASDVSHELGQVLEDFRARNDAPEYITFSGNGEPTLHPQFGRIVDEVEALRDLYVPAVPVAILSNSTTVHLDRIREALMRLDKRIMKLDAGDERTFSAINRPHPTLNLEEIVEGLCQLRGFSLQAAFMTGRVENIGRPNIEAWIRAIDRIRPEEVQMYTIDRPSAEAGIERVARPVLDEIAQEVMDRTGVVARVY